MAFESAQEIIQRVFPLTAAQLLEVGHRIDVLHKSGDPTARHSKDAVLPYTIQRLGKFYFLLGCKNVNKFWIPNGLIGKGNQGEVVYALDAFLISKLKPSQLKNVRLYKAKIHKPREQSKWNTMLGFVKRSVMIASQLGKPPIAQHIRKINKHGVVKCKLYQVCFFQTGNSLQQLLDDGTIDQLPLYRKFQTLVVIAGAIAEYHNRGATHRDIKPANIVIDFKKTTYALSAHLVDDDLVVLQNENQMIKSAVGTPMYVDPSAFDGIYSNVLDIHSFGPIIAQVVGVFYTEVAADKLKVFYELSKIATVNRTTRNKHTSKVPYNFEKILALGKSQGQFEQTIYRAVYHLAKSCTGPVEQRPSILKVRGTLLQLIEQARLLEIPVGLPYNDDMDIPDENDENNNNNNNNTCSAKFIV